MKHITAFIDSLGGGGAQGVFLTIMNYYASLGHSVTAVVGTLSNSVHHSGLDRRITVISLDANSGKECLPKIINFVRANTVELAFAFSPELTVNLIIAKVMFGRKFSIIARCINTLSYEYNYAEGLFRRIITKKIVEFFFHKADLVVAQAEVMRMDLIQNFGFLPEQVRTINNPLAPKYSNEINEYSLVERDNYILYVGRFEKQKGLDMLLEAFSRIPNTNIRLLLIGKGSLESSLKEKANHLQLDNRVDFLPFTKDIENYYKRAKLTVMSSLFEGFPNVLSESIACGTPVVAFDLPSGPSEIIVEGINGYLARYLDVDELSSKIALALDTTWNYMEVKKTARRFQQERILPLFNDIIEAI